MAARFRPARRPETASKQRCAAETSRGPPPSRPPARARLVSRSAAPPLRRSVSRPLGSRLSAAPPLASRHRGRAAVGDRSRHPDTSATASRAASDLARTSEWRPAKFLVVARGVAGPRHVRRRPHRDVRRRRRWRAPPPRPLSSTPTENLAPEGRGGPQRRVGAAPSPRAPPDARGPAPGATGSRHRPGDLPPEDRRSTARNPASGPRQHEAGAPSGATSAIAVAGCSDRPWTTFPRAAGLPNRVAAAPRPRLQLRPAPRPAGDDHEERRRAWTARCRTPRRASRRPGAGRAAPRRDRTRHRSCGVAVPGTRSPVREGARPCGVGRRPRDVEDEGPRAGRARRRGGGALPRDESPRPSPPGASRGSRDRGGTQVRRIEGLPARPAHLSLSTRFTPTTRSTGSAMWAATGTRRTPWGATRFGGAERRPSAAAQKAILDPAATATSLAACARDRGTRARRERSCRRPLTPTVNHAPEGPQVRRIMWRPAPRARASAPPSRAASPRARTCSTPRGQRPGAACASRHRLEAFLRTNRVTGLPTSIWGRRSTSARRRRSRARATTAAPAPRATCAGAEVRRFEISSGAARGTRHHPSR